MNKNIPILALMMVIISSLTFSTYAEQLGAKSRDTISGKELAFNRKKGNCLACHYIQGGDLMGNAGPALIAMKPRFPNRKELLDQIYDARTNNEHTLMPPFGAHGILSKQEIELVVNWLYTL
jgi:sulfur-oxidizing protein SoxX